MYKKSMIEEKEISKKPFYELSYGLSSQWKYLLLHKYYWYSLAVVCVFILTCVCMVTVGICPLICYSVVGIMLITILFSQCARRSGAKIKLLGKIRNKISIKQVNCLTARLERWLDLNIQVTITHPPHGFTFINVYYEDPSAFQPIKVLTILLSSPYKGNRFIHKIGSILSLYDYSCNRPIWAALRYWPELFLFPLLFFVLFVLAKMHLNALFCFVWMLVIAILGAILWRVGILISLLKEARVMYSIVTPYTIFCHTAPHLEELLEEGFKEKTWRNITTWRLIFPFLSFFGGN